MTGHITVSHVMSLAPVSRDHPLTLPLYAGYVLVSIIRHGFFLALSL